MIKAFFTALLIFFVCGLENVGHYFGVCTHGMLSSMFGFISSVAIGLAIYSKDISIFLIQQSLKGGYHGQSKT